ncbi:MAG: alpha-E domain-containing protein, partial [Prosthecobacter sp.]|nr:alpha-E domain-containing protein [Prosthecobacter sp.]
SEMHGRELRCCIGIMTQLGLLPKSATSLKDHLQALLQDAERENSIPSLLGRLRLNAAAARDRLSDDTWRLFNRIERDARLPAGPFVISTAQGVLDTLVLDLAAFSGMQQENMTRGHGWRFLEAGRRLERSCVILELVDAGARQAADDDSVLNPLLEICDSSMTYRRLHFARPLIMPVLDLLLLNDINPRSVAHQFNVLSRQAAQLPQDPAVDHGQRERQQMDVLQSALATLNLPALAKSPADAFKAVPALCQHLIANLEILSDIVTEHYFSHASKRD